jgi:hypothetical protein
MASQQMTAKLARHSAHADHELARKQQSLERLCADTIFAKHDHARAIAAASLRVAWATRRVITEAQDMAAKGASDRWITDYLDLALNDANRAGGTNHGTEKPVPPLGWPVLERNRSGTWCMV